MIFGRDRVSIPSIPWRKLLSYVGPGFLVSVGYADPGNWATSIEGGSRFGYNLLWVVLLSNVMALFLQSAAARLGLAAGLDLSQVCSKQYPMLIRVALWLLSEIAIAATDLAEVLGSAIGLNLLFSIPLLVGTAITALDSLLFLLIQHWGIRKLEALIGGLMLVIAGCFVVELFLCKPSVTGMLNGFVPRLTYDSLYVAIGIIGATAMPHNIYLHSSLVQTRVIGRDSASIREACLYNLVDTSIALNSAFFINVSILAVAAAVFYRNGIEVTRIQQAHDLLELLLDSRVAPIAFGLGLLSAGQSSTLTGTIAGEIVMSGFLNLKIRPWLRRMVTRLVAILPAIIIIAIAGDEGTYDLLIFSQVILAIELPFTIIPLVKFAGSSEVMGEFRSGRKTHIVTWTSVLLITSLNIWLIAGLLGQWYSMGYSRSVTYVAGPIAGMLLVFLGYLLWKPVKPVVEVVEEEEQSLLDALDELPVARPSRSTSLAPEMTPALARYGPNMSTSAITIEMPHSSTSPP